jgi:cardiolipin synthase
VQGSWFRPAHIPNLICVIRILLVWPVVQSLLGGQYLAGLVLIFIAGFSDGLDGFIAKRFDWRSRLGGLLDPLADKLLLVSTFLTLAWIGLVPTWIAAVVLGRDIVIVSGGLAYQFLVRPLQPEPSRASKFNTGSQLLYLLGTLAAAAIGGPPPPVLLALGALVFVTSIVSGMDYVIRWSLRALRGAPA